jgi:ATP-dependent protease Clp ATPase subunit
MSTLLECSFCCKSEREVEKLVAGAGGGHICDQCAEIAVQIMSAEASESFVERLVHFLRSRVGRSARSAQLECRAPAG